MPSPRIARVETFRVTYPIRGEFKFFAGPAGQARGRATLLVKVTADDGSCGWGQCVPSPRWSYETLESAESAIRLYLAPEIAGLDVFDFAAVHAAMNRAIAPAFSTGQPIAKAGVDLAIFDLTGKLLHRSPAQRWGHAEATEIELSWTLNPRSLEELESQMADGHAAGYRHFNLKVAPDAAFDLLAVRRLRALAPRATVWVDANGGYDVDQALAAAPGFADAGALAFEQPVAANRLSGLARLKRQGALPIVLDEPLASLTDLEEFTRLDLLDGAAIKVSRCGGLTEAQRMAEFLRDRGLLFLGSGLTDPDVSLAATVSLFAAYGLKYPAALNGPQFLRGSVLLAPLDVRQARIAAPTGPGLGVDVDERKLANVGNATLEAE